MPDENSPAGTNVTALSNQIYAALHPSFLRDPNTLFTQESLEKLECAYGLKQNDPDALVLAARSLVKRKIFKPMKTNDNALAFRLRAKEEAEKYYSLEIQTAMVYEQIEDSGGEGIWIKTIRQRLNMHEAAVVNAIKTLQSKNLVRDLHNVANSHRRMYIKTGVKQSERSTGGPWYTDGELDEAFVDQIMSILWRRIWEQSMQPSRAGRHAIDKINKKAEQQAELEKKRAARKPTKGTKTITPSEALAIRDKALGRGVQDPQQIADNYKKNKLIHEEWWPYPPGYTDYPKIDPLTEFILDSGCCKDDVVLTAADVGLALDLMVLDKKIEEVDCGRGGIGYKVTRMSMKPEVDRFNTFTEAPCGKCPVFDLCEEGGPVGPSNCEYFTEWLKN